MVRIVSILVCLLLIGCGGDVNSTPKPAKPQEVFLEVSYRALGWSPDRDKWYFLKLIQQKRDYRWGVIDSEDPHWIPTITKEELVVCSVGKDGSSPSEHYQIPARSGLSGFPFNSSVCGEDSIIVGINNDVCFFSPSRTRVIAANLGHIPRVEVSPSGNIACFSATKSGLRLYDLHTEKSRVLTGGRSEEHTSELQSR